MRRQIKEKTNILRSLILSLAICAGLTSGMTLIQEKEVSAAGYLTEILIGVMEIL